MPRPPGFGTIKEMPSHESEAYVLRLCDQLKEARMAVDISQERLADLSGVDHGVISRLESHKRIPALAALRDVAIALGLDWPTLCAAVEDRESETVNGGNDR